MYIYLDHQVYSFQEKNNFPKQVSKIESVHSLLPPNGFCEVQVGYVPTCYAFGPLLSLF